MQYGFGPAAKVGVQYSVLCNDNLYVCNDVSTLQYCLLYYNAILLYSVMKYTEYTVMLLKTRDLR